MIPISLAGLGVLMGLAQQSDAEAAEEEPAPAEKEDGENGETNDTGQSL